MKSGGKLTLSLVEAIHLVEKGKLAVKKTKTAKTGLSVAELLKRGEKTDKLICQQVSTYSDLRAKGYLVKSGFKFGTHFRIYARGEKIGEDHSGILVHAVPENFSMSMTELSRIVRLGHSVRKKMWLAVVDTDGDVTYYQIGRVTP